MKCLGGGEKEGEIEWNCNGESADGPAFAGDGSEVDPFSPPDFTDFQVLRL